MQQNRSLSGILLILTVLIVGAVGFYFYPQIRGTTRGVSDTSMANTKTYANAQFSVAYPEAYMLNDKPQTGSDINTIVFFGAKPDSTGQMLDTIYIARGINQIDASTNRYEMYTNKTLPSTVTKIPVTVGGESGTELIYRQFDQQKNDKYLVYFPHGTYMYEIQIDGPHSAENASLILSTFKF